MAEKKDGFRVTDAEGNLKAMYANKSEVVTYLRASHGDKATRLNKSEDGKAMELYDDEGGVLARITGDWGDE